MPVVIDQSETAPSRQRHLAVALEAPADALKSERLGDGCIRDAHLGGHRDRGQGVEHIVLARKIEYHREARHLAIDPNHVEMHLAVLGAKVLGTDIGVSRP